VGNPQLCRADFSPEKAPAAWAAGAFWKVNTRISGFGCEPLNGYSKGKLSEKAYC